MTMERRCSTLANENKFQQALSWLKHNLRLVVVVAVFALAVISIVFIALAGGNPLNRLRQIFSGSHYGSIPIDSHTTSGYAAFDDGLAIGTISGLFTYDMEGKETALAQNSMTVPQLRTGGDLVLACDIGGSAVCAIKAGHGEVYNEHLDGLLLDGDVSEDGAVCYAVSTQTTKTLLSVLDVNQHNIYNWYSETAFMPQCAISDGAGYLVGISLGQQNGTFESTAVVFSTKEEEPLTTVSLGNDYFLDLDFISGNTLCAVGEASIHFFNLTGDQLGVYDYSDTYLTHYDIQGDGFIVLATNKNRAGGQFTLTTLDTSGNQLSSLQVASPILDISAAGNYLAVLTEDDLIIYNARLKLCAQTSNADGATQVVARPNGTAMMISDGAAILFAA